MYQFLDGKDKHVFGRFTTGTLVNPEEHASFIIMDGGGSHGAPTHKAPINSKGKGAELTAFGTFLNILFITVYFAFTFNADIKHSQAHHCWHSLQFLPQQTIDTGQSN
jgi:hypothetical protein